ncbi:MAG TPA: UBP-type zinc finger domain-containing protein [Acidimicrobiia bacterium]|nr:UBP-type zinc finger domain-containing protein [Acidimicrobiia bacterium]
MDEPGTVAGWIVVADREGRPTTESCLHIGQVAEVAPSTRGGCEDCLREGTRWVHLRMCLTCGHVGCCDASPRRHARAHWHQGGHPLVRSEEPGEDWGWCFADELELAQS